MNLNEAAAPSANWQQTREQAYTISKVSSDSSPQLSSTWHLVSLVLHIIAATRLVQDHLLNWTGQRVVLACLLPEK